LDGVVDAFLRLAGAIVLETLALAVWNIGTRPPANMLRDVRAAARSPRALFTGFISLIVGLIFVAAATILLVPAVPDPVSHFVPVEIFTFLVALGIEFLVGNDLRRLVGGRSPDAGSAKD
jgi:uncharacterized membrane protein YbhN (UPF0104 family)